VLSFLRIPIRRQKLVLLVVDAAIVFLCLPLAVLLRNAGQPEALNPLTWQNVPAILLAFFRYYTGATGLTLGFFLIAFFVFDLYDVDSRWGSLRGLLYISFVCTVAFLALSTAFYIIPYWRLLRGALVIQTALVAIGIFGWRCVFSRLNSRVARRRRVMGVGAGPVARVLLAELLDNYREEFEVVGVVEDPSEDLLDLPGGIPILGARRDVDRAARSTGCSILVFAVPNRSGAVHAAMLRDILGLKTSGVDIYELPTFYKKITGRVPVEIIEDSWLIFNQGFVNPRNDSMERLRRLIDVVLATVLLILLSPVFLVIAMAIRLTSRGPVLYSQERLGMNRKPYRMIKFRSMVADAEEGGPVWSSGRGDSRVTPVGRILRRTRLDEIPNFINVLRGEMSVVGPRPERQHFVEELEEKIPYYGLRFSVKPGLTGWAQVNYSYGASIDDARRKLQYELYYIQERSLFLDIVILMKTVQTVLLRPGS
jgi:sugar transferase (PEP-CTERM system associated)